MKTFELITLGLDVLIVQDNKYSDDFSQNLHIHIFNMCDQENCLYIISKVQEQNEAREIFFSQKFWAVLGIGHGGCFKQNAQS